MFYIYRIRLPLNDYAPAYVGLTQWPRKRFRQHCNATSPLGAAIRACGVDNVIFEVIDSGDPNYIAERERALIAEHSTRKGGYNRSHGDYPPIHLNDDGLPAPPLRANSDAPLLITPFAELRSTWPRVRTRPFRA